jgi:hypothetical protein
LISTYKTTWCHNPEDQNVVLLNDQWSSHWRFPDVNVRHLVYTFIPHFVLLMKTWEKI